MLLSRPDFVEDVLVTHHRDFIKGQVVRDLRRLLGEGPVTSDGDLWLRERRLTPPAFRRERIAAYGDRMVKIAEQTVGGWRAGQRCELYATMARLTLANVAATLFGTELAGDADEVAAALATLAREQRQAIDLAYYRGLTTTEIAAMAAIPVGTVKSRLRYGLTALRGVLRQDTGEAQPEALAPQGSTHH